MSDTTKRASAEHEKQFRDTWELREDVADNIECQLAYDYAATYKLTPREIDYVGQIIIRKEAPND